MGNLQHNVLKMSEKYYSVSLVLLSYSESVVTACGHLCSMACYVCVAL